MPRKYNRHIFDVHILALALLSLKCSPAIANGDQRALTPEQWADSFRCDPPSEQAVRSGRTLSNIWQRLTGTKCVRDVSAWRFKYSDEVKSSFGLLVKEKSIDERLANLVYSIDVQNTGNVSWFYFNAGSAEEDLKNEYRVAGPAVNDERCAQELATMSELYDDLQERLEVARNANETGRADASLEERHIRLARVLDSYGRYESGSLDGKIFFTGLYDECISSQLISAKREEIQMRYCWAILDINRHLNPILRDRRKTQNENQQHALRAGVCLPKSCHSRTLRQSLKNQAIVQKLVNSQLQLPSSIYLDKTFKLDALYCLVDGDSEHARIPTSGKVYLVLVCCWIALCVGASLATSRGQLKPTTFREKFYKCLDLKQSWADLTSDRREPDKETLIDLDMLNPIKLIACMFCILCHTGLVMGSLAVSKGMLIKLVDETHFIAGGFLTTQLIDIFFVLSGLLVTYVSLRKYSEVLKVVRAKKCPDEKASRAHDSTASGSHFLKDARVFLGTCFELSLMRYVRIVPLYAFFFWFQREVYNSLGSGPFWDSGLNIDTRNGACRREPWYTPFTAVSAYRKPVDQCFAVTWSIANDIYYALTTSPMILMFLHRPKLVAYAILAFTVVSTVAAMDELIMQADVGSLWEFLEFNMVGVTMQFNLFYRIYTMPFYRAPAFLIGALAGYQLFRYEADKTGWPKWLTGRATITAFLYLFVHCTIAFSSPNLKKPLWPAMRFFVFLNWTLERSTWSAASAVIFLQMTTTWRHKLLLRPFASQTCRTLAKLTFAVIFIHYMIAFYMLHSFATPPLVTVLELVLAVLFNIVASFSIACVVHVAFENPLNKLIKMLLMSLLASRQNSKEKAQ